MLKKYYKSIIITILTVTVCLIPGNELDEFKFLKIPHLDKIIHFFIHLFLTSVIIFDYNSHKISRKKLNRLTLFYSITLGIIMEFVQELLISGRGAEVLDVLANTSGGIIGVILVNYYLNKYKPAKII